MKLCLLQDLNASKAAFTGHAHKMCQSRSINKGGAAFQLLDFIFHLRAHHDHIICSSVEEGAALHFTLSVISQWRFLSWELLGDVPADKSGQEGDELITSIQL